MRYNRKRGMDGQEVSGNMDWGKDKMIIELPWVSDNLRDMALAKVYREKAKWYVPTGNVPVQFEFCPPDNKERDLAELFYAARPAIEGLAEGVNLDSSVFFPITLTWGEIVEAGRITLTVGQ